MTAPLPVAASVQIDAAPDQVWAVVSDLGRMPEFSPELRKAYVFGGTGLGATILGINRRKAVAWPTTSKVVRWEPNQAVAWKTRESGATWVYELESTTTGTTLTGRRVLPAYTFGTTLMGPFIGGAAGHDGELAAGIEATLERIVVGLDEYRPDKGGPEVVVAMSSQLIGVVDDQDRIQWPVLTRDSFRNADWDGSMGTVADLEAAAAEPASTIDVEQP